MWIDLFVSINHRFVLRFDSLFERGRLYAIVQVSNHIRYFFIFFLALFQ